MKREEVRQLVTETLAHLGHSNLTINIEWKSRFTRRFGDAQYKRTPYPHGIIRFSIPLWERATDEERRQVVIHELCHVVQAAEHKQGTFSGGPHGYEWKRLMYKCGVKPERCHKIDRAGLRRKNVGQQFVIRCGCQVHTLGPVQTKRVKEGTKRYRCVKCKQELTYENVVKLKDSTPISLKVVIGENKKRRGG